MKNNCLKCNKYVEVDSFGYCEKCSKKLFKINKYTTKQQNKINNIMLKISILVIFVVVFVLGYIYREKIGNFALSLMNKHHDTTTTTPENPVSNEVASNKKVQETTYTYIYDTDIPDPKTLFDYNQPVTKTDSFINDGIYYVIYSSTSANPNISKEYNSNVNNPKDYNKYASILTQNGYSLINNSSEDGLNIYTYSKNNITIKISINSYIFTLEIKKQ